MWAERHVRCASSPGGGRAARDGHRDKAGEAHHARSRHLGTSFASSRAAADAISFRLENLRAGDETIDYYYNAAWPVVEERKNAPLAPFTAIGHTRLNSWLTRA